MVSPRAYVNGKGVEVPAGAAPSTPFGLGRSAATSRSRRTRLTTSRFAAETTAILSWGAPAT